MMAYLVNKKISRKSLVIDTIVKGLEGESRVQESGAQSSKETLSIEMSALV
jgi:hypothetical protein